MKSLSLNLREEKFKTDGILSKLDGQQPKTSLASTVSSDDLLNDIHMLKNEIEVSKTTMSQWGKNLEENNDKILNCANNFEYLKDSFENLEKSIQKQTGTKEIIRQDEKKTNFHDELLTNINDVRTHFTNEGERTKKVIEKITATITDIKTKCDDIDSLTTKNIKEIKNELSSTKKSSGDTNTKFYDELLVSINNVKKQFMNEEEKNKDNIAKINAVIQNMTIKCDDIDSLKTHINEMKNNVSSTKRSSDDVKICVKEIFSLKSECDKNTRDVKNITSRMDNLKTEKATETSKTEDLKIEKSTENEIYSLRIDYEKLNKNIQGVITDLTYIDSTFKKDSTNIKNEIRSISKEVKNMEEHLNSLHKMLDTDKSENNNNTNPKDITHLESELEKISLEIKGCKGDMENLLVEKLNNEKTDIEAKLKKSEDNIVGKVSKFSSELQIIQKQLEIPKKIGDSFSFEEKLTSLKSDFDGKNRQLENSLKKKLENDILQVDTNIQKTMDDVLSKVSSYSVENRSLENKLNENINNVDLNTNKKISEIRDEIMTKISTVTMGIKMLEEKSNKEGVYNENQFDSEYLGKQISEAKEAMTLTCEAKVQKCKEEIENKQMQSEKSIQQLKDSLKGTNTDMQQMKEIEKMVKKQDESFGKMQTIIDDLKNTSRTGEYDIQLLIFN